MDIPCCTDARDLSPHARQQGSPQAKLKLKIKIKNKFWKSNSVVECPMVKKWQSMMTNSTH